MSHSVTVHQLNSEIHSKHNKRLFMNVDSGVDILGVWTSIYKTPTYLVQKGATVYFMQFGSEELFDSWMEEVVGHGFVATRVEEPQCKTTP